MVYGLPLGYTGDPNLTNKTVASDTGEGKPSNVFTIAAPNHPASHSPFKELGSLYRQVSGAG